MKLNNLSRLTALLLALTMILSSVAWADPVAEGDYTFDNYEEMLAAQTGTCKHCASALGHFPKTDHLGNAIEITCVYEFLQGLGGTQNQYDFIKFMYDNIRTGWSTVMQEYDDHMTAGDAPILCSCKGMMTDPPIPGPDNHSAECPWYEVTTGTTVIYPPMPDPIPPKDPSKFEQYTSNVKYPLAELGNRAVILPEGGRAVIETGKADGYQWQVFDGTQWVDIQGENSADFAVTDAKLNTIFELTGVAELRYFDKANNIVVASVSVVSQEIAGGEYVDPVAEEEVQTLSLIERADSSTATFTLTVNYWYAGTTTPVFEPYTATYPANGKVNATIPFPVVVGYLANWPGEEDANGLIYTTSHIFTDYTITGNETYVVYYYPDNVGFMVLHQQQNVADDDYTTKEITPWDGRTNAPVPETGLENAYPGFYKLPYSTAGLVVAADGTTEVEVFYDRYYYLVKFQLGDGGYGTDPVYDRYGAPITVTNPTRPGYTFMGWDMAIDQNGDGMVDYTDMVNGEYVVDGTVDATPTAIPLGHQVYVAQWTAQETEYARAYWVLHEDGTKTYIGSEIVAAMSGDTVSGGDTLTVDTYVCGMAQEHTHDDTCEKLCTLPDHVHGDGNCVYICGKQEHDHSSGCYCDRVYEHGDTEHTRSCYTFTAADVSQSAASVNPQYYTTRAGFYIYRTGTYGNRQYYVRIDDSYYQISNFGNNTSLAHQLTCLHDYHTSACCTIEAHEHNADCCNVHVHDETCYSCDAVGHTHGDGCKTDLAKYVLFVNADQNVTVAGDGSSIVNVNYEYKTYTIRFIYARRDGSSYDVATSTSDGRLSSCSWGDNFSTLPTFDDPSGKTEVSSVVINGTTYYYISLTAKYGANIADIWPSANMGVAGGKYVWGSWAAEYGTGYRITYGNAHANIVGPYPIMSADMILDDYGETPLADGTYLAQNMIAWWAESRDNVANHAYHNYFELLPGEEEIAGQTYVTYGGKRYKLVQTYTFTAAHNGTTRVDPIYFNGYYCVNDTVDTSNDTQANSQNFANNGNCTICGTACRYCQNFYYDRNGHKLYFWNHNGYLQGGTGADVVYGEILSKYGSYVSDEFMAQPENYPEGLEANAYQFAGWYTTADCLDGTKVDWNSTMPDSDVTLYAKWEPVTHKVNFFLDRTQMENYLDDDDETIGTRYIDEVGVKHNEYVDDTLTAGDAQDQADLAKLANEQVDANYKNGVYTFIGWFYMDSNGKEKMFDPFDMQVKKDINLYGKWSSNELVSYTINYVDKDTKEVIADQMVGSALAGSTKTFDAKTGTALKDGYQSGYFPVVPSHSITMDLEDASKNVYTFEYIKKEAVPYAVYYLAETLKDGENPANYTKYPVDGKDYYIIAETKEVPDNAKSYVTENYKPVTGYLPDKYQKSLAVSVNADGTPNIDANKIYFFYEVNENSINYKVIHYIEDPKGTHVNSDVDVPSGMKWSQYGEVQTKPGISGQTVTESPLSIPNYTYQEKYSYYSDTPVAGEELTLRLYYTENEAKIKYVPVGPGGAWDGSGTAYVTNSDKATEETVEVITGSPTGATADADDPTYKFVGWYDNAACTGTPISTAEVFQPTKAENAVWLATTTYYAKFEYNLTSMKIQKAGALDTNDTFIFTVKGYGLPENGLKIMVAGNGYAIINGLTVGQVYTVEEDASWSWRYTAQYAEGATVETSHALVPDTTATADNHPNTVTVTNTQKHPYWLDGSAYTPNQFGEK